MAHEPTWTERLEDARRYVGPALAVAIVLGVGGWLAWRHFSGPGTRVRVSPAAAVDPSAWGRELTAESLAREQEALRAKEQGQPGLAADKARLALRLQTEANALVAADARDLPREARLRAFVAQLDMEPLRASVAIARSLATAARTRESWADALKALGDARTAQAELEARFPDSSTAERGMLEAIDAEIAEVQVAQAIARELGADAAAAQNRRTEAATAYAQAVDAWRDMAGRIARLQPEAAARIEALTAKRESVLAADALEKVTALDREAETMLRAKRGALAAEKIAEAAALLEQTARTFPRGMGAAAEMRRKIQFLAERRGALEAFDTEIARALVPLPGGQALGLFKTEIPQELFFRVMGSNPSRNAGPALPVDSVTWAEAREFCARLAWLLGRAVRLPTETEFRVARAAAPEIGWSGENAGGRTHAVGSGPAAKNGLADLAGNVAEWLESAQESADAARVAGGSYLDPPDVLRRTPVVVVEKRLRARHIGFRVVVEQ